MVLVNFKNILLLGMDSFGFGLILTLNDCLSHLFTYQLLNQLAALTWPSKCAN